MKDKFVIEELESENGYIFTFVSLKNRMIVNRFIKVMNKAIKESKTKIILDFRKSKPPSFPNVVLSLVGLTNYYRSTTNIDIEILVKKESYIDSIMIHKPLACNSNKELLENEIFDKVISFKTDKDIEFITENLLHQLQQQVICEEGVLVASSWCLNEIMDNVLNHSKAEQGYIMAQIHTKQKHIVFSIFDIGHGLYNTLKNTSYKPKSSLEAIRLSIMEGVTRDKDIGQGNGMWGLYNIVKNNKGILTIASGNAAIVMDYTKKEIEYPYGSLAYPSKTDQATLVDFMVDFSKKIDIKKALGNYEPFEKILRDLEENETSDGFVNINIKKEANGTGTRTSGKKIRKYIINILLVQKSSIELDFIDVENISSSFADEFVAKLLLELGFAKFSTKVRIINTNEFVSTIINKAVYQRQSVGK